MECISSGITLFIYYQPFHSTTINALFRLSFYQLQYVNVMFCCEKNCSVIPNGT